MTDLMPLQPENKIEILRILRESIPSCDEVYEFDRFLSFLRSKDQEFESYDISGKQRLLSDYLDSYIGEKKFRVGKDG